MVNAGKIKESEPECSTISTSSTGTPKSSQAKGSLSSAMVVPSMSTLAQENECNSAIYVGQDLSTSSSPVSSQPCGSQRSARASEQSLMDTSLTQPSAYKTAVSSSSHLPSVVRYNESDIMKKKRIQHTNSLGEVIVLTEHQISKRVKQLAFGKNTVGYINYRNVIGMSNRVKGKHMWTPDPKERISKRRFQGKLKYWRRFLHTYDDLTSPSTISTNRDMSSHEAVPSEMSES